MIKTTSMIAVCVGALLSYVAADARAGWPMKFSDGTVVEVIGIAENGSSDGKWWAPDGSDAPDPQFTANGMGSVQPQAGMKPLQVIAKTSGKDASSKSLVVRAEPDFARGLLKMRDASGELTQIFARAPQDKPTFTLRFGLAGGAWTDSAVWQKAGAPATQPANATLKFAGIEEDHGQTKVQFHLDHPAKGGAPAQMFATGFGGGGSGGPMRGGAGGGGGGGFGQMRGKGGMGMPGGPMILDMLLGDTSENQNVSVQARGKKLSPVGLEGGQDGSITMHFGCPKDQVEKVILSTRAYEWVEMQNISTQPAKTKTDVKITPVKPSATTMPSVKGTTP